MKVEKTRSLKIYLTSWQKRMIADLASSKYLERIRPDKLKVIEIEFKPGGCLASYKLPPDGIRIDDWVLYLTDEQMTMVTEVFGLKEHISAVNVSAQAMKSGEIRFM